MTQIYLVPLPTDALLHCQDALLFCWDTLLFCPDTLLFGQDLPLFFVTSLLKYRCTCGAYNSLFAPWREPGLSPSSSALILNEAQSYYDTKAGSNLEAPVKGGRTEADLELHESCLSTMTAWRAAIWKKVKQGTVCEKRPLNGQNVTKMDKISLDVGLKNIFIIGKAPCSSLTPTTATRRSKWSSTNIKWNGPGDCTSLQWQDKRKVWQIYKV